MTKAISETSKGKKAVYWVTTVITASAFLAIGAANLLRLPAMMAGFSHLGYPVYLATILGMWSMLGAAAIIAPGLPRLKEWAYAGMFFNLTGAALSHAASGDPRKEILMPLGLLVIALISMALRSARRRRRSAGARCSNRVIGESALVISCHVAPILKTAGHLKL